MSAFWDKFKKDSKEKAAANKPSASVGNDKKEEEKKKEEAQSVATGNKPEKEKKKKAKKIENYKEKAQLVNRTIIRPIISEDAMNKESLAKYVFEVDKQSNKNQIAEAVEAKYKVSVNKVNVLNYRPQSHRFRNNLGRKRGFRKAIVTIKKGEKIELFNE